MNVEAENEHFEISDSVIAWMEVRKASRDVAGTNNDANVTTRSDCEDISELLRSILPSSPSVHHQLSAPGLAINLVKIFSEKQSPIECQEKRLSDYYRTQSVKKSLSPQTQITSPEVLIADQSFDEAATDGQIINVHDSSSNVKLRGNNEWAPPRPQIIFNIHEETSFRKLMQRQNYLCAGCGTKIDLELARRLVVYCHYLGKYFCKCCFSHKAIHLPGYILQKWDFHKYTVSHFALQFLDRIANEPLFNINDINPSLYRKVKKLRHLVDIRMQLYYLKIYITTCTQTEKLSGEYSLFTHQHLLQDDVHLYSLNNLIEIQHGKLYEYLNDLVTRSIAHIAQCDRCRAKGHYCQLCGPCSFKTPTNSNVNGNASDNRHAREPLQARHKDSASDGQNILNETPTHSSPAKCSQTGSEGQLQYQKSGNHSRTSSGNYSNIAHSSTSLSGSSPTSQANTMISINVNEYELIFPFEIGRVAQCMGCGCCFHIRCYMDAGQNCPKCERIQRRRDEMQQAANTNSNINLSQTTMIIS